MRLSIIISVLLGGALGSSNIMAQTIGVEYTTEWQTDCKGGYDWLNLLKTSAQMPVIGYLSIEASTISTAKTGDKTLIDDRLTYSNIEAENIPLTLARLGLNLAIKDAVLFLGINNVNEDYFTSDMTSFFTNSSCGISPTISCNYDIANYPLAAWCLHYRQHIGNVDLQTSLYPGQGYSRIFGHDNLFSFDINRDGIFSISSIDYKRNGIYCVLGLALHHGVCMGDVEGEQGASTQSSPQKRLTAAPWLLSEISLPRNLGVYAHASYATVKQGCKGYASIGCIYEGTRLQPGVSLNYANFSCAHEWATEIACRIPMLNDKAYLQPVIHLISTDGNSTKCIGMMRFSIEI